jgi:hypothetical protein
MSLERAECIQRSPCENDQYYQEIDDLFVDIYPIVSRVFYCLHINNIDAMWRYLTRGRSPSSYDINGPREQKAMSNNTPRSVS